MSIFVNLYIVCALASLAAPAATQGFLAASPGVVTRDRVVQQLRSLLVGPQQNGRLALIKDVLRPTFMALPKDSRGSLEHRVSRYALHRYFIFRHGWHVKGLSSEAEVTNISSPAEMLKSGMPSFIFGLLEAQMGSDRVGLEELAVLAATVEDLVQSDSVGLLELAYKTHALSTDLPLSEEEADLLINTFGMYLVFPQIQEQAYLGHHHAMALLSQFRDVDPDWEDTSIWFEDMRQGLAYQDRSALQPFKATAGQGLDFTSMARWATSAGGSFGRHADTVCREMKAKMLDMQGEEREDGRVGLAQFYSTFAETGDVFFSESPAYLKHLGALDEHNPRKPSVITTNVLYGKSNCLSGSSFIAFCCVDACEGLMVGLEQQLSEPAAAATLIAAIVSAMPSDTVAAPRNLSAPLLSRLDEIAGRHNGRVILHSRLFAQWMHYAYPNECPYPRSLLTSESQLTVMEFVDQTKLNSTVSRKEIKALAEVAGRSQEEQGVSDAPIALWSEDEELLSDLFSAPGHGAAFSALQRIAGLAALVTSAVAILGTVRGELSDKFGKLNKQPRLGGVSASSAKRGTLVV